MLSWKVWFKLGLIVAVFLGLMAFACQSIRAQARPAPSASAEQRIPLGVWHQMTVPAESDWISIESQNYAEGLGVKLVYEFPAPPTGLEYRFIYADLCGILQGVNNPNWRKARIGRIELTDAYWELTGRVEVGTYTVCVFEFIPRF